MLKKNIVTILSIFAITFMSQLGNHLFAQINQSNEYIQITDENCFYKFEFKNEDVLHAKVVMNLPQGSYSFDCNLNKNDYYQSGIDDVDYVKFDCPQEEPKLHIIIGYEKNIPSSEIESKMIKIGIYVEVEHEKYYYEFKDENGLSKHYKIR